MKKSYQYSLLLFLTAIIWGAAFVAQSAGMEYVGPFTFNSIRSLIGGIILLPIIALIDYTRKKKISGTDKEPIDGAISMSWHNRDLIVGGVVCGILLFIATNLQQVGIMSTTAGKAGFITAFYIVLVPIFSLVIKKKPSPFVWPGVALAIIGLYLLCMNEGFSIATGDVLIFACAIGFSFQIMAVDHFAPKVDCLKLACIEFLICGTLSAVPMIFEKPEWSAIFDARVSILYAGILSCGVAYTLQMFAQKEVKPAVASLIMSLESVFSVLFGFLILHQKLTLKEGIGCIVMFLAVLLAQYQPRKKSNQAKNR